VLNKRLFRELRSCSTWPVCMRLWGWEGDAARMWGYIDGGWEGCAWKKKCEGMYKFMCLCDTMCTNIHICMYFFKLLWLLETVLQILALGLFAQIHVNLRWRVFGRNRNGDLQITRFLNCRALYHWPEVTDKSPKSL